MGQIKFYKYQFMQRSNNYFKNMFGAVYKDNIFFHKLIILIMELYLLFMSGY